MKEELIDSRYAKYLMAQYTFYYCVVFYDFCRLQELSAGRKAKLQDSLTLQQFYGSIHEEEAWIK